MVMKRYPHGAYGEFFFQKRAPSPRPDWIPICSIEHASGNIVDFPVINDLPSLLWVVNLGCIDLNQWYARCDDVDRPDYLHFDLDPVPTAGFECVLETALLVTEALDALKIKSYPKTTGSKGIHIYVPIVRGPMQKEVWTFAKELAQVLAARNPKLITAEYRIAKRPENHVLVDYNQNAWGRTLASVYSVRPKPHATVSTPVTWEEVEARHQTRRLPARQRAGAPARVGRSLQTTAGQDRPSAAGEILLNLPLSPPYLPMEAVTAAKIPAGPEWQYEPKWDGFRCIAFRDGGEIELQSKSGQPLGALLPGTARRPLASWPPSKFVLDGEIVIPDGGNLSFDELLQRIHPAESRVRKLSKETPAVLIAFDLLVDEQGEQLWPASRSRSPSAPGGVCRNDISTATRRWRFRPPPAISRWPRTGFKPWAADWTASSPSAWIWHINPASAAAW